MSKSKNIVSPAGIAKWVCVNKPSTKFKAEGQYSVEIAVPVADASALLESLKAQAQAVKAEKIKAEPKNGALKNYELHVPGETEYAEDGSETGNVVFKFKATANVTPKNGKPAFSVTIGVFDAKGKAMVNAPIGRGSRLKVAYQVVPFVNPATKKVGVTLRLQAVQVLELVKYSGGGFGSTGFGEEEGYTAEDADTDGGESTEAGNGTGDGKPTNGDF